MLLKRWEPFAERRSMETELDRMWRHLFRPAYTWPRHWAHGGRVDVDLYQDADNLRVRAAIPGVNPEDMDVTISEHTLTIHGESKLEKEVKEEDYLHRERQSGAVRRVVALPRGLNAEKAEATYENGILTVTIPKTEEGKPKALKVEVKAAKGKKA